MKALKLDEVFEKFNKDEGEEIISLGLPKYDYDKIPFSSPRMNYCTYGGIPQGKIVELYGEQHGGKTTTALDLVANYQKLENAREVLWCDIENALDAVWATKIGVDLTKVHILKPINQSAETIFQLICDAIQTNEIGLVVIDSIAALVSAQAMEKELTEKTYGGVSVALTNFVNKVVGLCQGYNCTLIGINQMRDVIGSMFPMQNTPGGRAWKHNSSVRMEFRRGKFIDDKGNELTSSCENPAGNIVLVSITKTRCFPPNRRTGTYTINYATGVDVVRDMFDLAIKYGAVDKKGAWFTIINIETGEIIKDKLQGQATAFSYLEDNPDVYDLLSKQILTKMNES